MDTAEHLCAQQGIDAVSNRDLTTVQTLVMLLVFFTLAINLATDLAYRVIDPRLKEKR